MQKIQMRYCQKCDATMPCTKSGPNHILHIILSIITVGWWLIVYGLLALGSAGNSWRCQKCNSKT